MQVARALSWSRALTRVASAVQRPAVPRVAVPLRITSAGPELVRTSALQNQQACWFSSGIGERLSKLKPTVKSNEHNNTELT